MKNIKKITLVIIFLLSFSFIFAGSIDYLSNQSAAYIRTLSRTNEELVIASETEKIAGKLKKSVK